jgi:hypothetical protein
VNVDDGSGYIDGTANVSLTGAYNGSGEIADPATNATFDIMTADIVAPVVTLSGSSPVNIFSGGVFTDEGANWTDMVDGSGTITAYNSGSVNTGALGSYSVSYVYVDGAGNTGSADRVVNVVDTVVPTASISYSTLSTTSGSVVATLTGASEAITIVNNAGSGNYTFVSNGSFTFIYTDASGNTGTTVATVNNIDTTAPVITIV